MVHLAGLSIRANQDRVAEGTVGYLQMVSFSVTRSGDLSIASTASWRIVTEPGGVDAADFYGGVLPSGTVSFAAGEVLKTVDVLVLSDGQPEGNERFGVALEQPSHGTGLLGNAQAWTTVHDVFLSVYVNQNSGLSEGSGGGVTPVTFTVSRSGDLSVASTASWRVVTEVGGADAADFQGGVLPSGTVSFAAGERIKTIELGVLRDDQIEAYERVGVVLDQPSNGTGLTSGNFEAWTWVRDDDAPTDVPPAFIGLQALVRGGVMEGTGGGTTIHQFRITRSHDDLPTPPLSWYVVTDASFNGPDARDFAGGIMPKGSVLFADGELSRIISFEVVQDDEMEADEVYDVRFVFRDYGVDYANSSARGIILNDDAEPASLDIAALTASRAEGTGSGVTVHEFLVTRSGNLDIAATARWSVQGSGGQPADAADFLGGVLPSGSVSFAAGQVSQVIKVRTQRDAVAERDEGFQVTLHNPGADVVLSTASASVTVLDDDTPGATYTLSPASSSKAEGTGSGVTVYEFTATRDGDLSAAAQVAWTATGSGAHAANAADFLGGVLPGGTLAFAAGQASQVVKVRVLRDATDEADEGFTVALRGPSGQVLASAGGTIANDDAAGLALTLTPSSSAREEGTGSGVTVYEFTATRDGDVSAAAQVAWTATGSGAHAANAADFLGGVLPGGTIAFAAGQASQVIKVRVLRDTTDEADEGFTVALRGPSGQVLASAGGTITNDDAARLALTITPASGARGEGTGSGVTVHEFTVTRAGDVSAAAETSWSVAGFGDHAADAADFLGGVLPGGVVAFAAGQASQTVKVRVLRDALAEADEAFAVLLQGARAEATILNDDGPFAPSADLMLIG
ncbi:Calx-beta domain-containing protein [Roseomonas sp. F4]